MKKIPLGKGLHALVDDEDYKRVVQYPWHDQGGYAVSVIGDIQVGMHKFVLNYEGQLLIDHRDLNKLNNQKCNLRFCTFQENMRNRKPSRRNTSGYKGVSWNKKLDKWVAQIFVNKKSYHIGLFDKVTDAAIAYDTWAKELFGEFAWLNFPPQSEPYMFEGTRTEQTDEVDDRGKLPQQHPSDYPNDW